MSTRLTAARFVERPSRFLVRAALRDGTVELAHLGDPGRLRELLLPGAALRLRAATPHAKRKTRYTVALVRAPGRDGAWVSVDTNRANDLAEELLQAGRVRGIGRHRELRREVRCGRSRFDFLLTGEHGEKTWIEVKSVTFAENGVGRFPDAPTARGRRHVAELTDRIRAGERALALFIVQRADVRSVTPFTRIDPAFTETLREARRAGLRLRAARYRLDPSARATYLGPVPVRV